MPQQTQPSVINNFSKGLKTEFTGLNFPEDACTSTDNCVFERIGDVHRRLGINYEDNFTTTTVDRTNKAINHYRWRNAGGDGNHQLLVKQIGSTLYFYKSSSATTASPLSTQLLAGTVDLTTYTATGGSFDATVECQFSDGRGYLFVFHTSMDPIYVKYNTTTDAIASVAIAVQIRDIQGADDGLEDSLRPPSLNNFHPYNLFNQGWQNTPDWTATATTAVPNDSGTGAHTFTVQTGLTISAGQSVRIGITEYTNFGGGPYYGSGNGVVTSYNSGTGALVLNVTSSTLVGSDGPNIDMAWNFVHEDTDNIDTFFTDVGLYPSNADQWWNFIDDSATPPTFDPSVTNSLVTLGTSPAPKGHTIFSVFNQNRNIYGTAAITPVATTARPRTGCWFANRVWYAGTDAFFDATGQDGVFDYSWTETIYYSQIAEKTAQFGKCFQINDPTSKDIFDALPTDGGTIHIVGCGAIYKLYPIQNGLMVFAANGIWFITGSSGIGFTSNDYSVNKISSVQCISGVSFVDIQGYPVFWNEEAIYTVTLGKTDNLYDASRGAAGGAGVQVQPMTYTTIASFYDQIPLTSKKYARGDYDAVNFNIQWVFRSTEASSVTERYEYDRILNYNVVSQSFYPWTVATDGPSINGIAWVQNPGGSGAPDPIFKYAVSDGTSHTFAEERDANYVDWHAVADQNFTSTFTTGYHIKGGDLYKQQTNYIRFFFNNQEQASYKVQGIWDYAVGSNSNKFTPLELVTITEDPEDFSVVQRRQRDNGRGLAVQFKITSVAGEPFDCLGWTMEDKINQGM